MKINFNGNGMTISVLICTFLFLFEAVEAAQIGFHPRIEAGRMDYSIEYAAFGTATTSTPGQTTGLNKTSNEVTYSDNMNFVGAGATLSINRFFIDLSGQYAYDGDSTTQSKWSWYSQAEDGDTNLTGETSLNRARFDHTERAIAVGYAIRPDFSVFMGYKWTDVDFKLTMDGTLIGYYPDVGAFSEATMHKDRFVRFKYEGPFIGAKRGWDINNFRFLKGTATIKLALAYLNSTYTHVQHVKMHDFFDDSDEYWTDHEKAKGETWGFTLGLGWRGNTPIRNLTYALNIGGYRYHFNNDNGNIGEISETVIKYKANISYGF